MSFEESGDALRKTESILAETFVDDVGGELRLADDAASLLLAVLRAVKGRTFTLEVAEDGSLAGDVNGLHTLAQVYIGIRAFRTIRAARAVLAMGYEAESRALDRIVVELQAHRQAIIADATGAEALAWLKRERVYGITKRVKASGAPQDLYGNLSTDSHGDPAPVGRLQGEDGMIELAPKRTVATRASLLMHAGFARDQTAVIAQLAGIRLGGLEELTDAIREAWRALDELAAPLSRPSRERVRATTERAPRRQIQTDRSLR